MINPINLVTINCLLSQYSNYSLRLRISINVVTGARHIITNKYSLSDSSDHIIQDREKNKNGLYKSQDCNKMVKNDLYVQWVC